MNEFHIVSALCRQIVKDGPSKAVLNQMDRLYHSLEESGSTDEAKLLKNLIKKADTNKMMEGSGLSLSKVSYLKGQELTPNTKVPVDKDNGSPLANIIFPNQLANRQMPIFPTRLTQAIEQLVKEWANLEKLQELNIPPSLSCLLYGAPGTGKTELAMYLARTLDMPIVLAKLDGLVSSLLGTSARNITNLFNFVSRYNCILLLDEFDAVAKSRSDNQEVGEIKRVVNTLLQSIDQRAKIGMTIAITNHESLLDPAIWRRFDVRIFVPKPNLEARQQIIARFINPLCLPKEKLDFLALLTEGFSGSDIEVFITHYKRHIALCESTVDFITLIRSLLNISASMRSEMADMVLESSDREVIYKLNKELNIPQTQIAIIFDTNLSRISRTVRDLKNKGN